MTDWQPIETAPKDGTDLLAYSAWSEQQFVVFWRDGDWAAVIQNDGSPYRVGGLHYWMPLPEPPNEGSMIVPNTPEGDG
jgi:hypothetical protein